MSNRGTGLYYPAVPIPEKVVIAGDMLRWKAGSNSRAGADAHQWRSPTDRTLTEFARLHDAAPESVRTFAARHGVLNVAKVPKKYQQQNDIRVPDGSVWAFSAITGGEGEEPLHLWHFFSKRLRAILRINTALKGRSRSPLPAPGLNEDWEILDPGGTPIEDARDAQFFLVEVINDVLRSGSVGIELGIAKWSRQSTDWKLEIKYNGLLGGLAYRLLLTVVGERNLYSCDGCGCPYIRTKKAPRAGQENFCDDCTEVAQRRASQRWKEKHR